MGVDRSLKQGFLSRSVRRVALGDFLGYGRNIGHRAQCTATWLWVFPVSVSPSYDISHIDTAIVTRLVTVRCLRSGDLAVSFDF